MPRSPEKRPTSSEKTHQSSESHRQADLFSHFPKRFYPGQGSFGKNASDQQTTSTGADAGSGFPSYKLFPSSTPSDSGNTKHGQADGTSRQDQSRAIFWGVDTTDNMFKKFGLNHSSLTENTPRSNSERLGSSSNRPEEHSGENITRLIQEAYNTTKHLFSDHSVQKTNDARETISTTLNKNLNDIEQASSSDKPITEILQNRDLDATQEFPGEIAFLDKPSGEHPQEAIPTLNRILYEVFWKHCLGLDTPPPDLQSRGFNDRTLITPSEFQDLLKHYGKEEPRDNHTYLTIVERSVRNINRVLLRELYTYISEIRISPSNMVFVHNAFYALNNRNTAIGYQEFHDFVTQFVPTRVSQSWDLYNTAVEKAKEGRLISIPDYPENVTQVINIFLADELSKYTDESHTANNAITASNGINIVMSYNSFNNFIKEFGRTGPADQYTYSNVLEHAVQTINRALIDEIRPLMDNPEPQNKYYAIREAVRTICFHNLVIDLEKFNSIVSRLGGQAISEEAYRNIVKRAASTIMESMESHGVSYLEQTSPDLSGKSDASPMATNDEILLLDKSADRMFTATDKTPGEHPKEAIPTLNRILYEVIWESCVSDEMPPPDLQMIGLFDDRFLITLHKFQDFLQVYDGENIDDHAYSTIVSRLVRNINYFLANELYTCIKDIYISPHNIVNVYDAIYEAHNRNTVIGYQEFHNFVAQFAPSKASQSWDLYDAALEKAHGGGLIDTPIYTEETFQVINKFLVAELSKYVNGSNSAKNAIIDLNKHNITISFNDFNKFIEKFGKTGPVDHHIYTNIIEHSIQLMNREILEEIRPLMDHSESYDDYHAIKSTIKMIYSYNFIKIQTFDTIVRQLGGEEITPERYRNIVQRAESTIMESMGSHGVSYREQTPPELSKQSNASPMPTNHEILPLDKYVAQISTATNKTSEELAEEAISTTLNRNLNEVFWKYCVGLDTPPPDLQSMGFNDRTLITPPEFQALLKHYGKEEPRENHTYSTIVERSVRNINHVLLRELYTYIDNTYISTSDMISVYDTFYNLNNRNTVIGYQEFHDFVTQFLPTRVPEPGLLYNDAVKKGKEGRVFSTFNYTKDVSRSINNLLADELFEYTNEPDNANNAILALKAQNATISFYDFNKVIKEFGKTGPADQYTYTNVVEHAVQALNRTLLEKIRPLMDNDEIPSKPSAVKEAIRSIYAYNLVIDLADFNRIVSRLGGQAISEEAYRNIVQRADEMPPLDKFTDQMFAATNKTSEKLAEEAITTTLNKNLKEVFWKYCLGLDTPPPDLQSLGFNDRTTLMTPSEFRDLLKQYDKEEPRDNHTYSTIVERSVRNINHHLLHELYNHTVYIYIPASNLVPVYDAFYDINNRNTVIEYQEFHDFVAQFAPTRVPQAELLYNTAVENGKEGHITSIPKFPEKVSQVINIFLADELSEYTNEANTINNVITALNSVDITMTYNSFNGFITELSKTGPADQYIYSNVLERAVQAINRALLEEIRPLMDNPEPQDKYYAIKAAVRTIYFYNFVIDREKFNSIVSRLGGQEISEEKYRDIVKRAKITTMEDMG